MQSSDDFFLLAVFGKMIAVASTFYKLSEMERRTLDSCGNKRKLKTPQAKPRRLSFLPAESECLESNGTNLFLPFDHIKKQQSMRKRFFFF